MQLKWEDAENSGEDGQYDQNADSAIVAHGYWAIGPSHHGQWSVELRENDEYGDELMTGGVHLGDHHDETAAKAAAQHYEDTHQRGEPGTEPPRRP